MSGAAKLGWFAVFGPAGESSAWAVLDAAARAGSVLALPSAVSKKRWLGALVVGLALSAARIVSWLHATPPRAHGLGRDLGGGAAAASARPTLETELAAVQRPTTAPPIGSAAPPVQTLERDTPALENTDNYALFGIDRRGDGKGPMLADSIIVLVLDRESGHVGVVSVPRDTYVPLVDGTPGRINSVLQVARRAQQDPLELGKRVVSDTLELPIRHALALDLGVFERAVDSLGGVDVDVPCAIRDRFVDTREPSGHAWLDVDPGVRLMDGRMAALYVRSRHGRSDFSRARRQQAVLVGLRAELESAGGLTRLPSLWQQFERSVHTDLRRYQLFDLARRVLAAGPERLHGLVLNHPHVRPMRTDDGSSVLELDRDATRKALRGLFSAQLPGSRASRQCPPKDIALPPLPELLGAEAHSAGTGAEARRRSSSLATSNGASSTPPGASSTSVQSKAR